MTLYELKLQQMTNQYLITPGKTADVLRDLCGVQAQFFANAVHSIKIRTTDFDEAFMGDTLVKNWTVRGTVHIFSESDLPLFLHCRDGADYRKNEWSGESFWNQREKWALTPERQAYFTDIILDALSTGPLTRESLKEICRNHGMTQPEEGSMFDSWGGGIREMCERGFINGTASMEKAFRLSPDFTPIPEEEAKLEMARRYFTHFAPATVHDAMYYFHTSAAQVKKWLSALPVLSADCGGKTYFYMETGRDIRGEIPKCLFLAGFDQLMLGYEKKESLYIDPAHLRNIFNAAGIVMPTVLLDGRVVGTWKKKGGTLTLTPFQSLPNSDLAAARGKAESLWGDIEKITTESNG